MVAKGLDFENVTLSAVLDADLSLYASDYRAAETTFSLIAQVAGRAGRGKLGGRAILQTMTPQNQTIRFAAPFSRQSCRCASCAAARPIAICSP